MYRKTRFGAELTNRNLILQRSARGVCPRAVFAFACVGGAKIGYNNDGCTPYLCGKSKKFPQIAKFGLQKQLFCGIMNLHKN